MNEQTDKNTGSTPAQESLFSQDPADQQSNPETDSSNKKDDKNAALERWKAKLAILDEIELARVLEVLGADPNQDGDRSKWKCEGYNIILGKKNVWLNGNTGTGGKGPVSFLISINNWEDEDRKTSKAMEWLAKNFPDELEGDWVIPVRDEEEEDDFKGFRPPERRDDTLDAVADYLITKRKIPPSLVQREIAAGSLYGTKKWNNELREWGEPQCVFIGPSSAEVRSVLPNGLKGCCPGSNTESSGYQVMFRGGHTNVVTQTEAAVDALSYHALYPGEFTISTNGAGRFELQYKLTLEALRNGFASNWAYDADHAGDLAAQRLFNALYLRETLSQKFGVTPERIDEFILSKKIIAIPTESPHEMFLNNCTEEGHSVGVFSRGKKGEEPSMTLSEVKKPATIAYKVLKQCAPELQQGKFEDEVSVAQIQDILKRNNVARMRPQGAKDWNEVWKRLGTQAIEKYEERFNEGYVGLSPANSGKPAVAPQESAAKSVPSQHDQKAQESASQNAEPVQHAGTSRPSRFARQVRRQ